MGLRWLCLLGFSVAAVVASDAAADADKPEPTPSPEHEFGKAMEEARNTSATLEAAAKRVHETESDEAAVKAIGDDILKAAGRSVPTEDDIKQLREVQAKHRAHMNLLRKNAKAAARNVKHWARKMEHAQRHAGVSEHVYEHAYGEAEHYSERLEHTVEHAGDRGKRSIEHIYEGLERQWEGQIREARREAEKKAAAEEKATEQKADAEKEAAEQKAAAEKEAAEKKAAAKEEAAAEKEEAELPHKTEAPSTQGFPWAPPVQTAEFVSSNEVPFVLLATCASLSVLMGAVRVAAIYLRHREEESNDGAFYLMA